MYVNTRSIIAMLILAAVAGGVVFIFNNSTISQLQRPRVVITPDTFNGTKDIQYGDVVEITGTPDVLNAVGFEDRSTGAIVKYFVPLKEYGNNFVVEIKKIKLKTEPQQFVGIVDGLSSGEFGTRIKNTLNKPVELSDADRAELDSDTIQILNEQTTNEFTSKTLLLVDGNTPEASNVLAGLVFWGILVWLVMVLLLRQSIFNLPTK